ncbi:AraC family transcriptional regulator [Enterococcus sp. HY326]|uniref:AraC family transcriptional regulator n=1 Tax=Enterococcus sp. HY326 TaxID=2971265 RepID=UPI00223EC52F|nr:AraC family transcriptional regulator [Enterococcus sp. HY326]
MKQKELYEQLLGLSEHERGYRSGDYAFDFSKNKTIEIKNQSIILMELPKSQEEFRKLPFFIKQHSRFQTFPLHCHDWIEFNYMFAGSCQQIINDTAHHLATGQVILMDANTVHTIEPLGEKDVLINLIIPKNYLTANFFNRFSADSVLASFFIEAITKGMSHDDYIFFPAENSERLQYFFKELLCEWFEPSIAYQDICENLLSLIISELVIVYQENYSTFSDQRRNNPIIPILRYIETHYADITLTQLANSFSLNPNYLSNLLKKHTGQSYKQIVINQRILAAHRILLSSNRSVVDIAQQVGFENIHFFYQKFKEIYHMTPGEVRNILKS